MYRAQFGTFKKNAGFTLVEIVVVIALIGVAATTIISLIDPITQFKKTRDTQRKSDLRQMQSALELYRADQGTYPVALPACGSPLTVDVATYVQKVPCDPRNTGELVYHYISDGITYSLIACLENAKDILKDSVNNTTYCTGGTTNWSYTLINP